MVNSLNVCMGYAHRQSGEVATSWTSSREEGLVELEEEGVDCVEDVCRHPQKATDDEYLLLCRSHQFVLAHATAS
jgi:hypothetical protein